MQRGQDKVSGKGGLNGVLGRFDVPHLAEHDNIRILSQYVPQDGGKGDSHHRLNGNLIEILMDHFNGVFHGRYVDLGSGKISQGRVEGGGLPAPGGPADQHDSVRHFYEFFKADKIRFRKTNALEILKKDIGIHDPHHHLLSKGNGNRGDPDFRLYPLPARLDSSILWPPLFGHI